MITRQQLVTTSETVFVTLDSLAEVQKGVKIAYDPSSGRYVPSGGATQQVASALFGETVGWLTQATARTVTGESYETLERGLLQTATKVKQLVQAICAAAKEEADRDFVDTAAQVVENLEYRLMRAEVGLETLLECYRGEQLKHGRLTRATRELRGSLLKEVKELKERVLTVKALKEREAYGVCYLQRNEEILKRLAGRVRTLSGKWQSAANGGSPAVKAKMDAPDPLTGLRRSDRIAYAQYIAAQGEKLEKRLLEQAKRVPTVPLIPFSADEGAKLPYPSHLSPKGVVVHLPNKLGKGAAKVVRLSVRLGADPNRVGKTFALARSDISDLTRLKAAQNEELFLRHFRGARGLVKAKYIWEKERHQYILMRHYDLGTLNGAKLSPKQVLLVLEDVLQGLATMHGNRDEEGGAAPIVHMDIKPENIFLESAAKREREGVAAALGDFGASCFVSNIESGGTPIFMSPELVHSLVNPCRESYAKVGVATDIWSLACSFWKLVLEGELPWVSFGRECANFGEYLSQGVPQMKTRPEEPEEGTLAHLLWEMLAYKAEERPTAAELLKRVGALLKSDAEIE